MTHKSVLFWGSLVFGTTVFAQDVRISPAPFNRKINCDERGSFFCLDRFTRINYEGEYVGHDEPSVIFYSNTPGSGNQSIYNIILPKDPPALPKQDGTGGTFNFQLHPTFWLGMALCDTQSAPNPDKNGTCIPNSDTNIFNNTNPRAADYIGKHPGTAFLELQFYPPGWINSPGISVSNRYFAALNIDSLSINTNTNRPNNRDCQNQVGDEPVNFAIITKNGVPLNPANPLGADFGSSNPDFANVLLMRAGDSLRVTIKDTPAGLIALIEDLTSRQSGFIVAGPDSGFGQVDYDPTARSCSVTPYAFHPMYSTASESTRVPWATHSYNIAFSDEIGHFEFCDGFNMDQNDPNFLNCTNAPRNPFTVDSKVDADDAPCANPDFFGFPSTFVPVIGCVGDDLDFNGPPYDFTWPGTGNIATDAILHPTPIQFTSPVFQGPTGNLENYERIAFETDLPAFDPSCNTRTGAGCQNPPAGAKFYPMYTTTSTGPHQCWWQFGGANIQGTLNTFGGTPAAEYGDLYPLAYAGSRGVIFSSENYHRTLNSNPCQFIP